MRLPDAALFCAGCGLRLPRSQAAPVWVLVLFWLGAAATLWVAVLYGALAAGLLPAGGIPTGTDPGTLRSTTAMLAAAAASVFVAHLVAALGLMGGRPWSRPFATLVCVTWGLTCVGLPLGLLAVGALWRPRNLGQAPGTDR
jgi:hypothetical protein